jgi:DNA-binding response OmpR family regulator
MKPTYKIMIVEESPDISILTSKIFQYQKWDVTRAISSEIALELLVDNQIDIILMDINLPGISGIECCRMIRQLSDPIKSKTPIIAVTGNEYGFTLEEYINRGFNYFLQKPVNFEVLLDRIRKILK